MNTLGKGGATSSRNTRPADGTHAPLIDLATGLLRSPTLALRDELEVDVPAWATRYGADQLTDWLQRTAAESPWRALWPSDIRARLEAELRPPHPLDGTQAATRQRAPLTRARLAGETCHRCHVPGHHT